MKKILSSDEKYNILSNSAKECGLDSHITFVDKRSELYTYAEKMMGSFSNCKNPHKNSYLFCDSVDACFFIERERANVTFSARWFVGSKDLSLERMTKTLLIINKMLETMQLKINQRMPQDSEVSV